MSPVNPLRNNSQQLTTFRTNLPAGVLQVRRPSQPHGGRADRRRVPHLPSSGDGDDGIDGEDRDGGDGGDGEYGLDDAKAGDDDDAGMGAEGHDGDDAAAAAGDARGRQRNAHGKAKMTPTSQAAAPPDAKGRRIHLGDRWGNGSHGRGGGGGTDTRKADEASERHEITSDGDQRQTTGHEVMGARRVGSYAQTPTTAADRQPDGKKGRLKIDLARAWRRARAAAVAGRHLRARRPRGGRVVTCQEASSARRREARAAVGGGDTGYESSSPTG